MSLSRPVGDLRLPTTCMYIDGGDTMDYTESKLQGIDAI